MKNLFYGEKHSFIELTYVVCAHWNGNSNVYLKHVTEIMETFFEIFTKQVSCPLNTSIKIPVTIWQIVYIYMTAISQNLIS